MLSSTWRILKTVDVSSYWQVCSSIDWLDIGLLLWLSPHCWRTVKSESFLIELKVLIKLIEFARLPPDFLRSSFCLILYLQYRIWNTTANNCKFLSTLLCTTISIECKKYFRIFFHLIYSGYWLVMWPAHILHSVSVLFTVSIVPHCNTPKWIFMERLIKLVGKYQL